MSKWRPQELNCLYVIPDIHGQFQSLKLICDRIFPLRKSDGGKDILVLLGDYIDRGPQTPEIIDFLIKSKEKYNEQIVCLMGNHEQMMLNAIKSSVNSYNYLFWMKNGGEQTVSSYLDRANQHLDNPYELPRQRVIDFIPQKHIDFLNSLKGYYETENHIFVHAGCDPDWPLAKQKLDELIWDNSLIEFIAISKPEDRAWGKTIVVGHHGNKEGKPIITNKFMMLDCSYGKKLLVVEINSMKAFVAKRGNKALVKFDLCD